MRRDRPGISQLIHRQNRGRLHINQALGQAETVQRQIDTRILEVAYLEVCGVALRGQRRSTRAKEMVTGILAYKLHQRAAIGWYAFNQKRRGHQPMDKHQTDQKGNQAV